MKRFQCMPILALAMAMMMVGFVAVSIASEQHSVVAWVTDQYMLKTDAGELLEVADTDMGNDLLGHVGKKVEVFGKITKAEGIKTIRVASYTVIEE